MSYDIDIEHQSIDIARAAGELETEVGNYTYNCGRMFATATGEDKWISDLDGMLCKDALPLITKAVENMEKDPETYRAMNPENGWGNYDSFLKYVRKFRDACAKYPDSKVVVS